MDFLSIDVTQVSAEAIDKPQAVICVSTFVTSYWSMRRKRKKKPLNIAGIIL